MLFSKVHKFYMSEYCAFTLEQLLELNAIFEQIEPNWRQNYERYKRECQTEAKLLELLGSRTKITKPRRSGPAETYKGLTADEVERLSASPGACEFGLELDPSTLLYDLVIYF